MPWRGPQYEGEFPSLGWDVVDWAEAHFKVPDGPFAGDLLRLTDEQVRILVRFYALDDRGRFVWRRAAVRRAQGWGKSPLLAVVALAELAGPSRFGGWDDDGEPIGKPPAAPWVQIAAVSEDQTDNTYSALYTMAQESDLNGSVLDVGLTRIHLKGVAGAKLEAVTSAAGTRLGQRITFAVLDETHLWTRRNGGHKLAATIRRNAAKMGGRTFESTNAHEVGEDSVAERTCKAAENGAAGLLYDSVEPEDADNIDLHDRQAVLAALKVAYGDAAWVNLERIADDIADPATDPDDARRFFFNCAATAGQRPVDLKVWADLADAGHVVPDGARVALGFDGSISDDKTALYGVHEGHIFEVEVWARPVDAPRDWRVPRQQVHDAIARCFDRWDVGLMLYDPAKWWTEGEEWALRWPGRVVALDTNKAYAFAPACGRFMTEVRERKVTHDGGSNLTGALAACAKRKVRVADDEDDGRTQYVFVKADVRKIDEAVAAVLALEAEARMPDVNGPSVYEARGLISL